MTPHSPPKSRPREQSTRAYINHGRWVVECQCGNAVEAVPRPVTHPGHSAPHQIRVGQKRYRCEPWGVEADPSGFCGSTYTVIWPRNARRIVAVLNYRPRHNQNWRPGETVALLVAENLEHGCAVPDEEER